MEKKNHPQQNSKNPVLLKNTQEVHFESRPIPAPNEFEYYEKVLPGAADRILRMAEKEQESRLTARIKEHELIGKLALKGQLFAFSLGLLGIGGSVFLSYMDKDIMGAAIFIGSIGTLI